MKILCAALIAASLNAQAPVQRDTEVFGQKIHYVEAGAGPVVVLLHGLGADTSSWAFTIPTLAKHFHVYAPDQIGFGQSAKPEINYRVETLVEFLDGFYQKLGIGKATVVGNSLGGWTAMAFALAHPDKVEKLVLVDSAGYALPAGAEPEQIRARLRQLNPSTIEGTKVLLGIIFTNPQMANDANARQAFEGHLKKNDGYTISQFTESIVRGEDVVDGKLGAIKNPTLLIWGREDQLTPLDGEERMAREIAGAQSLILDHCGHVPQMECAGPFNAGLVKFLSGQ